MRIFIEPLHILKKDGYRMKIQFDFIADVLISATGESDVNAVYCDENVWLTQKMAGEYKERKGWDFSIMWKLIRLIII